MIHIDFNEPQTRKWRRWRTDCKRETDALIEAIENGVDADIKSLYRRKSIKDEVYFHKLGPFHGKCAYCECYITDFQHGNMEHFRPKQGVTDEDDHSIRMTLADGTQADHPGYYWLAYHWRNLLPSCTDCNQPSVIDGQKLGKHSRFPILGAYAVKDDEIAAEHPLLIHPIEEEPADHLMVDTATGLMQNLSERGAMCIRIFGLNLRDRLPEKRKQAINDVEALLDTIIHNPDPNAKQQALEDLQEIRSGRREYALAARTYIAEVGPLLQGLFGDDEP